MLMTSTLSVLPQAGMNNAAAYLVTILLAGKQSNEPNLGLKSQRFVDEYCIFIFDFGIVLFAVLKGMQCSFIRANFFKPVKAAVIISI